MKKPVIRRETLLFKSERPDTFEARTLYELNGILVECSSSFSGMPKTLGQFKECVSLHDAQISQNWDKKGKEIEDIIIQAFIDSFSKPATE